MIMLSISICEEGDCSQQLVRGVMKGHHTDCTMRPLIPDSTPSEPYENISNRAVLSSPPVRGVRTRQSRGKDQPQSAFYQLRKGGPEGRQRRTFSNNSASSLVGSQLRLPTNGVSGESDTRSVKYISSSRLSMGKGLVFPTPQSLLKIEHLLKALSASASSSERYFTGYTLWYSCPNLPMVTYGCSPDGPADRPANRPRTTGERFVRFLATIEGQSWSRGASLLHLTVA